MLLAAVLLAATVARAQDDYNPNRAHEGWYYGVTVGLNVANMAKEEGGDALVRTNGGVFGGYRVGRFLAVQAGNCSTRVRGRACTSMISKARRSTMSCT